MFLLRKVFFLSAGSSFCRGVSRTASSQAKLKPEKETDRSEEMLPQIPLEVKDEDLIASQAWFTPTPAPADPKEVGFWKSDRGLEIKDQALTVVGRAMRLFVSKERYDNMFENVLTRELEKVKKFNEADEMTLHKHGPEWAFGQIVYNLGGALKVLYDDRWVEDIRCLRTPKRKDFRIEALDLRKSSINSLGLQHLKDVKHVRYMNVADAQHFDDHALAALHPISDSLEYLDISGTAITERGLGYIRLFPKLRYLNLSRLEGFKNLEGLLPLIEEIVPEHCCIVTDDFEPADSYGCDIPYRNPKNVKKDLPAPEEHKNIGNLLMFNEGTGMEVDLYRHDTIHELWRTPTIGPLRHYRLRCQQNMDKTRLHTLVKYIVKAEKYKPLL